ncbi:MAG TPA: hypothetical protein VMR29_09640, partial [Candidatus Binatia bacterium]|nr:hypothetical protein [Candidatus Binatia bacterium]
MTAVRSRTNHCKTRAIGVFALALVLAASSPHEATAGGPAPHEATAGGPAQLAFTEGAGRSGSVLVVVAANDAEALALFGALRELLERLHLRLRPVRSEASGERKGALIGPGMAAGEDRACVAVDARSADRVSIEAYGVRDGGLAPPVERTVLRTDSSAIVVEQVAHVVYATLESMLAIAEPGPEQEANVPTAASDPKDPAAALPADDAQGPQMPRARFGLDA